VTAEEATAEFWMALPREAHHSGNFNSLARSLGEKTPIELQSVSTARPKPSQPSFPIIVAGRDRNSSDVIRVALDLYNGRHTINARVWYSDDDLLKPGKTGMTLAVKYLPTIANAAAKALQRAHEVGLLGDRGEQ